MADVSRPIATLSPETQARIKSSAQITSLIDVVSGLVRNSLDARASWVRVEIDPSKGYCSVLDDGVGVPAHEFLDSGGLGRLYHTSKADHVPPSSDYYGRYGRFLASLSAVALLSITSKSRASEGVSHAFFKDGRRVAAHINAEDGDVERYEHATKVVVHDLFGKLPVRVKQRVLQMDRRPGLDNDFYSAKRCLVALLLAALTPFSVDLYDINCDRRFRHKVSNHIARPLSDSQNIAAIFGHAELVAGQSHEHWRSASARSTTISVHAHISLLPAPSKAGQFIAYHSLPLDKEHVPFLYDEVNSLFSNSAFGAYEDAHIPQQSYYGGVQKTPRSDGYTIRQLVRSRKGVSRWPVFFMRIGGPSDRLGTLDEELSFGQTGPVEQALLSIIRTLVLEFLDLHGYKTQKKRTDRRKLDAYNTNRNGNAGLEKTLLSRSRALDQWSRIKSTRPELLRDITAGLPFSSTNAQAPCVPFTAAGRFGSIDVWDDDADTIVWQDHRGSRPVLLDSRTGIAIPGSVNRATHVGRPVPRDLESVAKAAEQLLPWSDLEAPIPSLLDQERTHELGLGARFITLADDDVRVGCRLSKADLMSAQIVQQIDNKFILATVNSPSDQDVSGNDLLILVDQHAADERVKVEELFDHLCHTEAVALFQPITFEVPLSEWRPLERFRDYFGSWRVHYEVQPAADAASTPTVRVTALPQSVAERCCLEPKLVIDMLRQEIWSEQSADRRRHRNFGDNWMCKINGCPAGLLSLIISRACRSAIMFNDVLTVECCQSLVRRLSRCHFPFQCAHGRPSMTCLGQLQTADGSRLVAQNYSTFGQAWHVWAAPKPQR